MRRNRRAKFIGRLDIVQRGHPSVLDLPPDDDFDEFLIIGPMRRKAARDPDSLGPRFELFNRGG